MCVVKIFQPKDYKGVNLVNEKVLTKEITQLQTELTDKIDDVNTTLDTKIDETKEELESNLNSAKEELGQKIDETEQKLDSKIDTTKQGLEEKINTEKQALETKIDQTKQKAESDLNSAKEELGQQIQTTEETLRGELQATDTKLDNKIDTTKTDLEGQIEQAKTELTGNLESTETEIKEEIKTTKEGLEGKITEAENTLNSTINSAKSDLENKIDETKQQLQQSIDTKADNNTVTSLSQRVDEIDQDKASKTELNTAKEEIQKSIDKNAQDITAANELIHSTTTRIDEELEELDGKITTNTGSIASLQEQANATDETVTALSSKVDGLESGKVDSTTYETKIQELEEEIEDRVTTENFNKKLEEYTNTTVLTELLNAKADDTDITELESKIIEATDKASSDLDTHAKDTTLHPTQEKQQEWDAKVDAATLETAKQEITNAYKEAISTAVGTVFNWKGSVQTKDELGDKEAEAKVGDVWNVRETGANYVWSGPKGDISGGWDKLSENLEGFATKDNLDGHIRDTNVHFDGDEKASFKSSLQSNTSSIASLNSAMFDHNSKIELLQKEDKSINAKLETKADQTDLDALDDKVDNDIATLNAHTTNTDVHFSDGGEKTKWRGDIDTNTSGLSGLRGEFEAHAENSDIHFRDSEKNEWKQDIDQAKSDITTLQSNTQGTAIELSELQSKVEQNETTLTTHIADTTNAHFEEGEKARLKKEVEDNKAAIATKAEESKVTTLEEKVDQFIESVGKEWDSETSSTSESPQSGKAVKGAIDEALKSYTSTEGLTELLKEKADKNTVTELQSIVEGHTVSITEIQDSLNDKVDDAKLTEQLQAYTLLTTFNEHTTDTDLHVDAAKQSKWNAKVDTELLDSTVNTAKIELEAKINEVEKKIPEVDKTYDAESFESSTNAQSGVSVKGALDMLHSQITSETESTLTNYITTTDLNKKLEDKADKTTLETHINNTDVHFKENEKSQWETKINTTAENLETVTTQVTSNSNNIELLQTKDTVHDAAIQSNTTNITKLQNTVSALESQVETLETEVVTVENTYKPQSEDAISGKGVADALSGYTNTTDLTGFLNDKATKTELSQVEDKLGQYLTIEDAVAGYAAKTEVATLTEEVNKKAMQESVTALQQRVEEMVTQEAFETALEDYTTTEELNTQINGLESSITAAQSTATKAQSNLETHIVDETKHPSIQKQQEWSAKVDSATLESTKEQITQAYQDAINKAVGSVFKWKGTVQSKSNLQEKESTAQVGDVWNVTDEGGANYVWSGSAEEEGSGWDKLSENLEGFATDADLTAHTSNNNFHFTESQKNEWNQTIQSNKSGLATVTQQVQEHSTSIQELQNADKTFTSQLALKATTESVEAVKQDLQAFKDSVDLEWDSQESPASEGPQSGKAVAQAIEEHASDTTIHVTKQEKDNWATKEYVTGLTEGLATDGKITELTTKVTKAQTDIDEHKADTGVHFQDNEEKTKWTDKIDENAETLTTVSSQVVDIQGKYETLDQSVKQAQKDILTKAATSEITRLDSELDTLEGQIPTVDLKYTEETFADSVNAQSGKSVDGAIKAALSGYATSEFVTQAVNTAKSELTTKLGTLQAAVESKIDDTALQSALKAYTNTESLTKLLEDKVSKTDLQQVDDKFGQYVSTEYASTNYATKAELNNLDAEVKLKATKEQLDAVDEKVDKRVTNDALELELANYVKTTDLSKQLQEKANNTDIERLESSIAEKVGQEAITTALEAYTTTTDLNAQLKLKADKTELENYVEQTDFNELQGTVEEHTESINTLTTDLNSKVSDAQLTQQLTAYTLKSSFDGHVQDTTTHVTANERKEWNAKIDTEVLNDAVKTGDDAVKEALTAQITEVQGSIPKVDATYNAESFATSVNAQSGKSVQGALTALHTEITSETSSSISRALANYVTTSTLEEKEGELTTKIDAAQSAGDTAQSNLTKHINETDKHVSTSEKTKWNEKIDQVTLDSTISEAKQSIKADYTDAINTAIGSVFTWKGTVDSLDDLKEKSDTAKTGDVYNVTNEGGANYVFSGDKESENEGWDKLSENLDGLATKAELTNHTGNDTLHFTAEQKSQWQTDISKAKTNITSLTSQVEGLSTNLESTTSQASSNAAQIELLQKADQDINNKLSNKVNSTEFEELETTVTQLDDKFGQYVSQEEASTTYATKQEVKTVKDDVALKATKTEVTELTQRVDECVTNDGLTEKLKNYNVMTDDITKAVITKVLIYTDATKAPALDKREAGVLYLIAEASS